jgi:hypothetical protein
MENNAGFLLGKGELSKTDFKCCTHIANIMNMGNAPVQPHSIDAAIS